LIGAALKGVGILSLSMEEISIAAFGIVLLFSDVSINLIVDKIFGRKL
jgi:hypothetical protein